MGRTGTEARRSEIDDAARRGSQVRGGPGRWLAVLVAGALIAGVLTSGTGVASAGACDTVAPGEWLGTWADDLSPTIGGVVKFNLSFSGTSVTGVMEFATGQTVFAGDDSVSGTRSAGSCTFTAEIGNLVTIAGVIASSGAEITGGYIYHPTGSPAYPGTWQIGRVTSSASGTGTALTTDPESMGVSSSVPLVSDVSSPTPGPITINQAILTGGSLHGFSVLDTIVRITAPAASPTAPLALTFLLDSSVTGGLAPSSLTVYRNGEPVGLCLGAVPPIVIDPCVSVREPLAAPLDGVRFTVLTSAASTWAFATPSTAVTGLRITTTGLAAADLGHTYSHGFDAAGGLPPFKWKRVSKLPKGLKLATKTGILSGIPKKQSGTLAFTVRVTDKSKATATKTLSITVGPGATQIATASLPDGAVGVAYSTTLQATNGTAPYKWKKLSKLPKGLRLNAKTGLISGTPKQTGTFAVMVQVRDLYWASATKSFTIVVH